MSAIKSIESQFDIKFFIGRFEPFHEGHAQVVDQALASGSSEVVLVIGSADTNGLSPKNPWTFSERKQMIRSALEERCKAAHPEYSKKQLNKLLSRIRITGTNDFGSDGAWTLGVKAAVVKPYLCESVENALNAYLAGDKKDLLNRYFTDLENQAKLKANPDDASIKPVVKPFKREVKHIRQLMAAVEQAYLALKIAITGFEKDSSSYYIKKCFPELRFLDVNYYQVDGVGGLDSTKVRGLYFKDMLAGHPLAVQLPPAILTALQKFRAHHARFEQLRQTYEAQEAVKAQEKAQEETNLLLSGLPFFDFGRMDSSEVCTGALASTV